MNYLRTIRKVINHKLTIELPKNFKSTEVEVIVLPIQNENREIMILSMESFDEWDNEEDEIYDRL